MNVLEPPASPTAAARVYASMDRRLAGHVRRLMASLALVLALGATVGAATGQADPAPQQWQPTAADLVRTVRPCPMQISAPAPPVCWSMTEDASAWMAQPPGSPYPWGQCTYYVGVIRPDIWNDRASPAVDSLDDWDAWTWVEHAQAEGLSVDGNPQAGDVMVYSRAAVGNSTGHVTIVDSVGGTDPGTGDLIVTVSEMNVEGLDDASQGQGDTTTLLLPRSQLVPGMIQFIHKPQPGYTPPAWPSGWSDQTALPAPGLQDPSLAAALSADRVQAVSQSPALLQATVSDVVTGRTVETLTIPANRPTALNLPGGSYRVCIAQAPAPGFSGAQTCVTGSWAGAVATRIQLGHPRRAGRAIAVPVIVVPGTSLRPVPAGVSVTAGASLAATARVTITGARRSRRGRTRPTRLTYRTTIHLRAGSQELRLALPAHVQVPPGAVVDVRIAAATATAASAHLATKLA